MPYNDWDNVIESYLHYENSQYTEHASAILTLIPTLQSDLEDIRFDFGTSHSVLFFTIPDSRKTVNVWGESHQKYKVYVYHPDEGNSKETYADLEGVTEVIREYIEMLANEK